MSQLLDRFIDLNVKFEKMSRKEKEVKHKKMLDLISTEIIKNLGEYTDSVIDAFVASITCVIVYNSKFTQEQYNRITTLTPFASLPVFKVYKESVELMQKNTSLVLKDFFKLVSKNQHLMNEKVIPTCVEFLATLNGEIEFLMMYSKMFKG